MARPQKEGLDYFPLDCDFDQKDNLIVTKSKFGMQGIGIVVKLLSEIYRNGYFYKWTEREHNVFSDRVKVDINYINEVVNECIKWGFFNKSVFDNHNVLTSEEIQEQYIEAAKRRKEISLLEDYVLINAARLCERLSVNIAIINDIGDRVNVYIKPDKNGLSYAETPQSKVKESKEKKSKELKPKIPSPRPKKSYAEDSPYYKLAVYFFSKLKENAEALNIGHVLAKTNLQSWADDFRKMIDLKKYPEPEIRKLIEWVTNDTFWRKNVLSAGTLMEKYPSLVTKMASEGLEVQQNQRKGNSYNNRNGGKRPLQTVTDNGQPLAMRTKEEYRAMLNRACEAERKPLLTDAEFESKWSQYQERRSQAG